MKIQIAGYGFVGKAHAFALAGGNDSVIVYDPALGYTNWYEDADCVIIAVSTPENEDDGSCDMRNVYGVLETCPDVPILIKSTISLEGWVSIENNFPDKQITFSPEYLRANHAVEDFKKQQVIQLGGGEIAFWVELLSKKLNCKLEVADPKELILSKYFINTFLATKVAFFNQVYDLCEAAGVDYALVSHFITQDRRIGKSHTQITRERGFGGHCFPKDTSAICRTGERYGESMSIIESARKYNNQLRMDMSNVIHIDTAKSNQ
jgi:UDPglucose 6-dehydrogenase